MVLWNQEFLLIKSCNRESRIRRSLVLDLRFLLGSILPYTQKWILARRFFGNGYKIERKMLMSFRFKTTLGNRDSKKRFCTKGKNAYFLCFLEMVNLEKDFKIREWHFLSLFLSTVECLACFWYCLCTVGPLWENMRLAFQIIKQKAYFFPLFLSYLLTQYLFFCLKTLRLSTIW